MNERWVRSGDSGDAHLVKLSGGLYFTVACRRIVGKDKAVTVDTKRVASANRPGSYMLLPLAGDVCQECKDKAILQA